jgi:hypothetical protein
LRETGNFIAKILWNLYDFGEKRLRRLWLESEDKPLDLEEPGNMKLHENPVEGLRVFWIDRDAKSPSCYITDKAIESVVNDDVKFAWEAFGWDNDKENKEKNLFIANLGYRFSEEHHLLWHHHCLMFIFFNDSTWGTQTAGSYRLTMGIEDLHSVDEDTNTENIPRNRN